MKKISVTISLLDSGCVVESGIHNHAFNDEIDGIAYIAKLIQLAKSVNYIRGSESELLAEALNKIKDTTK